MLGSTAGIVLGLIGLLIMTAESDRGHYGTVETIEIESQILGKTMRLSVFLPERSSTDSSVLYFIPYAGGGPGIVTRMIQSDPKSAALLRSPEIAPLIIVAVRHDSSFLLDTEGDGVTTASGIVLSRGAYESFFINEVIPTIEKRCAPGTTRERRFLGGYSMGGHAALRIGIGYSDLFSRIGGHSPTLFVDLVPDPAVQEFLYPDANTRKARDPLRMPLPERLGRDTAFFIDTGRGDVNRVACVKMAERLDSAGIEVEFAYLAGGHGTEYLWNHFPAYLKFYGSR